MTMSLVKIVPRQRNWLSSDDMMAARIPAVSSPPNKGPVCVLTKKGRIALGLEGRGGFAGTRLEVAQMPINTHGTQTIMIKTGCATTGNLKLLALFAVSQCWKR